ncbi:MAG: hypothetical protein ACR2PT_13095 [Endozoicomonas sp.]
MTILKSLLVTAGYSVLRSVSFFCFQIAKAFKKLWLLVFLTFTSSHAAVNGTLCIGLFVSPPWSYPVNPGESAKGLLAEMYRQAMMELNITDFELKAAPALRIVKQLNRGSITMAMLSDSMLPHLGRDIICTEPFTRSVIRRYNLTDTPSGLNTHYDFAIPNESTAYLSYVVPGDARYQAVRASLLPELLASGRYRYIIDFESRIEPLLKKAGIDYQSTVLSSSPVRVCIQRSFPDSEKIMAVTADVIGRFRFSDHGRKLFLQHGIDPETSLPLSRKTTTQ